MGSRKLLLTSGLIALLALGACGGEEEARLDEESGLEEEAEMAEEAAEEFGELGEVLGNGIDDDGDGLVDERP